MNADAGPSREHGLDALRVFAFALLILYHSCLAYVPWVWIINDASSTRALEPFLLAVNRWRLPLLFFISGAAASFSLRHRTWAAFARERITRLLVPLVVGMLVIVPPQVLLERLARGERLSCLGLYRHILGHYLDGAQSWHHLWFLAYVLSFSIVCMPALAVIRAPRGRRALDAAARACTRWPPLVYAVVLPGALAAATLGPRWPTTYNLVSDWANLCSTLLLFLWGFAMASSRACLDLVTARRRELLGVALAVAALFFLAHLAGLARAAPSPALTLFWAVVNTAYAMTWILALVGWARALVVAPYPWLREANLAVYPLYLFHQTVTVAAVYLLLTWRVSLWVKLPLVVAATFVVSWSLYEVVRHVRWLRPLFGLKLQGAAAHATLAGARHPSVS